MEFCPKCETRLVRKKDELSLICPKCGESKEKTDQIKIVCISRYFLGNDSKNKQQCKFP